MGRPRNVHGDQNRNLGQDLYVRLHIYPSLAAAIADASTAEARLCYIGSSQSVWFGRPGAWVELQANAGASGGSYPGPGSLPTGSTVNPGNIASANDATGDITFVGSIAGLGLSVGDTLVVAGSLDAGSVAFLDGTYSILSVDELTQTVNVGAGAFPAPTLPVSVWGTAAAYVGAPPDGDIAVVNPDPVTGGPAIWVFRAATNTWARHTDEDPRIVLIDASRVFTAFPQVDIAAGDPSAARELVNLAYAIRLSRGTILDGISIQAVVPGPSDAVTLNVVADAAWVGKRIAIAQGNANDGTYTITGASGNDVLVAGGSLTIPTGVLGTAVIREAAALSPAPESFVNAAVAAHDAAYPHALLQTAAQVDALIGTNHELPTQMFAGLSVLSISAATQRITFSALLPSGIRPGMSVSVTGSLANDGVYTVYAVGANYVELKAGTITVTETPALTTADIIRGYDHNDIASGAISAGLGAHVADAADPHAAAGYVKASELPTLAVTQASLSAQIAAHNSQANAHGGVPQRLESFVETLNALEGARYILGPVDPQSVTFAAGLPLEVDPITGVWIPLQNGVNRPMGVLESLTDPEVIGTCDYTGNAPAGRISVSNGLDGTNFIPGSAYNFFGTPIIVDRVDGDDLFMRSPVPNSTVLGGSISEYRNTSRVVISGIMPIPVPKIRVDNAPLVRISSTGLFGPNAPSMRVASDGSKALGAVRFGDTVTVTGHTATEGKNTTFDVQAIDADPNVLTIQGIPGDLIAPQAASVSLSTNSIQFAAYVPMYLVQAGMTVEISGSGAGNDGLYTISTYDRWTRTIGLAELVTADEAVVTVRVITNALAPVLKPNYSGVVGAIGPADENILQITAGVVRVKKGTVLFAVPGRSLQLSSVAAVSTVDGSYVISAVTPFAEYDEITVTGAPGSLDRPDGIWGIAAVDAWGINNIASIAVDDGSGNGEITYKNAVTGSVLVGDTLTITGTPDNNGIYTVQSIVSPTKIQVQDLIAGTDLLAPAGTANVTRTDVQNGTFDVSYAGLANAFLPSPGAPTPFFVDFTQPELYSTTFGRWRLGYQLDEETFLVCIESTIENRVQRVDALNYSSLAPAPVEGYRTLIYTALQNPADPTFNTNGIQTYTNGGWVYESLQEGTIVTVDDTEHVWVAQDTDFRSLSERAAVSAPLPGSIAIARNLGTFYRATIDMATNVQAPSGFIDGDTFRLIVEQDAVGGWNLTWDVAYRTAGLPSPTTTANSITIYTITRSGTDYIVGMDVTGA